MHMPHPSRSRSTAAALALVFLASMNIVPAYASSESSVTIDEVIGADAFQEFPIYIQVGETVKVDVEVRVGPSVGFYFVDQVGHEAFTDAWPSVAGFTGYITDLSALNSRSIHRSAPAPAGEVFWLIIANNDPSDPAVVKGSITSSSELTAALFWVIVIVVAVVAVVIVIAVVVTRSIRTKAQQYSPPGTPTPQGQTHQHATSSLRPVVQAGIGRSCPKCGAAVVRGAATCAKCGTRL